MLKITGTDVGESLDGTDGNDEIHLLGGSDYCAAGFGDDVVYAGVGDDVVYGGDGYDTIYDGGNYINRLGYFNVVDGGNDIFYGEGADDWLSGGIGNDTLVGGAGDDKLDGGAEDDKLDGGAGDDKLVGGAGNDKLDGGVGNDSLDGGYGTDSAIFSKASSSYTFQFDGPSLSITDKVTNEKSSLISIEKLSFAGVTNDVSVFGKVSVDFNTLSIPDKKVILEEQFKTLIYEGTKKWSGTSFTYSFAQAQVNSDASKYSHIPAGETYKFQVLGSYLQNLTRETFNYLSSLLPLSFTETNNTQSATFKLESHNMTAGGYATIPTYSNSGIIEISSESNSDSLGQYGVSTLIHELGHSLGLDHTSSREAVTAGGGDDAPSLPDYLDRSTLSMMSYADQWNVDFNYSYQASYSALDIRALFSLYGKRESTEATTFKLHYDSSLSSTSKMSSLNTIKTSQWDIYGYAGFMIVDNGGTDTVDVSDWKGGVKVDLSGWGIGPIGGVATSYTFDSITNGEIISKESGSAIVTIYPDTVIEKVIGSHEADVIIGYRAAETLDGGAGNDQITGAGGNDTLNGGAGTDTAVFSGNRANYTIIKTSTGWTVSSTAEGVDTLADIERFTFADAATRLDISGIAGQAYRVYQAAFNRTPDNGGLKHWIGLMDGGYTLAGVASGFIASAEFKTLYGPNPTNELFVSKLYDNVLHRTPDEGGYNYWVGLLNTNKIDTISTLINFSESTENQAGVIGVIQNGIDLLN